MGRRSALIIEAGGERFRFYYDADQPAVLHITRRHGTTVEDAVQAFFDRNPALWNEARARFEPPASGTSCTGRVTHTTGR